MEKRGCRLSLGGLFLVAVLAGLTQSAAGGTRRHDRDDSLYTGLALDYPSVGKVNVPDSIGSGTLIGTNWLLTAAHVVDGVSTGTGCQFAVGGDTYGFAEIILHPDWNGDFADGADLALVRLNKLNFNIAPSAFYTGSDELDKTGTYVGFGKTGTGITGATEPSGTKRAGQNVIDKLGGFLSYPDEILLADFDRPRPPLNRMGSPQPINLEYCIAPGDSGGGMFIESGGENKVAGVASFGVLYGTTDWDYGDVMAATRVSSFSAWIDATIAATGDVMRWTVAANGSFNTPGNWEQDRVIPGYSRAVVPGLNDSAVFDKAGTYTVSLPADITNNRLFVSNGAVTFDLAGYAYTLQYTGADGSVVVGDNAAVANAQLIVTNGTLWGNHGVIGSVAGSQGAVTVSGAAATWTNSGDLYVGLNGAGILEITDGANVSNTNAYIGYASAAVGTVTVSGSGSTWTNSGDLYVGCDGTGTLVISDGGSVSSGCVFIGGYDDGTSELAVALIDSAVADLGEPVELADAEAASLSIESEAGDFADALPRLMSASCPLDAATGGEGVPEPATVSLLVMGALVLMRRRHAH